MLKCIYIKGSKINIKNLCEQFIKKTVYRQSSARKSIFLYLLSNSWIRKNRSYSCPTCRKLVSESNWLVFLFPQNKKYHKTNQRNPHIDQPMSGKIDFFSFNALIFRYFKTKLVCGFFFFLKFTFMCFKNLETRALCSTKNKGK